MMHSRQHKDKISDVKTDDSYWGFGCYCVQGDLIVWSQSRQQFVEQAQICDGTWPQKVKFVTPLSLRRHISVTAPVTMDHL